VYSWIAKISNDTGSGLTYDTCNPYMACSIESNEGMCGSVSSHAWECRPDNICRTCSTFTASGGACVEVDSYPNVTVKDFGSVSGADEMAKEIYTRGPIACGVDAEPLHNYTGGVHRAAAQPAAFEARTRCFALIPPMVSALIPLDAPSHPRATGDRGRGERCEPHHLDRGVGR
jgi:hypothetical protein